MNGSLVIKTETQCMKTFCTVDEDFDLTNIVRPRSSPLKEKFLINGERRIFGALLVETKLI